MAKNYQYCRPYTEGWEIFQRVWSILIDMNRTVIATYRKTPKFGHLFNFDKNFRPEKKIFF